MEQELKNKVAELERKIAELESKILVMQREMIVVVGDYDGTNLPVRANGIRRKIATAAP
jgi:hypothetical protein